MQNNVERALSHQNNNSGLLPYFLITFAVSLLVSVPLWTNKMYYGDDFMRLANGTGDAWMLNGRPLTTALHYFLSFGSSINDISPLPLLAGLAALSFSAVYFVAGLKLNLSPVAQLLLCLGVVVNPFLAQPMLYTWDSASILGAFSLAMLAATTSSGARLKNIAASGGMLLCALMLYQLAVNLYLSCVVIAALALTLRDKPIIYFLLDKACAVVAAIVAYKFVVVPLLTMDEYSLIHSELISPARHTFADTASTVKDFYALIRLAYPDWKGVFVVVPLLLAWCCVFPLVKNSLADSGRRHRTLIAALVVISPLLLMLLLPGVSLVLNNPVVAPRMLPGFSAITLFSMLILFSVLPKKLHALLVAGFALGLLYSAVMMTAVFNTMKKEQDYLSSVMWMIKADLARTGGAENVAFLSVLQRFPDTGIAKKSFPLIEAVRPAVPTYTYPYFFQNRATSLPIVKLTPEMAEFKPEAFISQSCDYRLYLYRTTAIVDFTPRC